MKKCTTDHKGITKLQIYSTNMKHTALLHVIFLALFGPAEALFFEFLKKRICPIPLIRLLFRCNDAPASVPTVAPIITIAPLSPTVDDACSPFPCSVNYFCLSEQGAFKCFCEAGFAGDPLTGCTGLPDLSLTGVSPKTFNSANATLCFVIINDMFKTDAATMNITLNGNLMSPQQLTVSVSEVCFKVNFLSVSSAIECSISAKAVKSGTTLSLTEKFWIGSVTANITVVDSKGQKVTNQEVTVRARLADDTTVQKEQVGSSGIFVFENLPLRTIIFEAIAADGSSGTLGITGK